MTNLLLRTRLNPHGGNEVNCELKCSVKWTDIARLGIQSGNDRISIFIKLSIVPPEYVNFNVK